MKGKRVGIILIAVAVLLLIPFIAMQVTDQVNWSVFDFVVMSILLSGTGLIFDLVVRKVNDMRSKIIICAVVMIVFFLVWAELAVGIFGTPFAGS